MAERGPKNLDAGSRTTWLRRILQRFTARRAGGDVIAASVEQGAQGVAVGKNIIQIGTFQIPIWALIALLIVVAAGLGYIALQLTPAGPKQMEGVWNIAVAPFVKAKPQGLFGGTAIDNKYSLWVFEALERQKAAFEQFDPKLSISIWNDSMPASEKGAPIGPILGDTAETRRQLALDVAKRIRADVIIYGNIDSQGGFMPEFYVKPQLEHDVDAIAGRYQLGSTPIQLDSSNATATADKLATRANALFWLVVGVDYIVRGDMPKAFVALDRAQNEFLQMGSQEGEELLYFFRGQAQLFQARDAIGNRCSLDKVKPYLDEAANSLKQALDRNPAFLRAQVALSGVYHLRALCVPVAARLTSKELAQAVAEAKRSLELAPQSEDRVTAEGRAVYQLGIVYNLLGSTYLELGRAALKDGKADLAKQQLAEADRNFDLAIAQVQQSREPMSKADNPQRAQAQVYRALGNATAQKAIVRQAQNQTDDLATLYAAANQYYQQCVDQGKANEDDKVLQRIINEATVGCAPRAKFVQDALKQLSS